MIKSNTIIDPTQSPPVVVVVGENLSAALGSVNRAGAEKGNGS